jgi:hypothetical protein
MVLLEQPIFSHLFNKSLMYHLWGRGEVYTRFWWGNMMERDHLEDPAVDGRIKLRWIFGKWFGGAWTGLVWFRIGTDGGHL